MAKRKTWVSHGCHMFESENEITDEKTYVFTFNYEKLEDCIFEDIQTLQAEYPNIIKSEIY